MSAFGDEVDADEMAARLAFLERLAADRDAGAVHAVADYQREWPGFEGAIADEYARAFDGSADEGRRVGPYQLVCELGRGGQAAVYLAQDTRLPRQVALKVMPRLAANRDDTARFRREVEAVSRLDDSAICPIYDVGEDAEHLYFAMRYLPGGSLADRIRERQRASAGSGAGAGASDSGREADRGTTTPGRVRPELRLVEQFEALARSLHRAHELGIVHRDIKPGNIMLGADGQFVLVDFGLARDEATTAATLTRTGDLFGTPGYMAPEQVTGQRADARADVWALGVCLYEALTCRRPFDGASREALFRAIQMDSPADPRRWNRAIPSDLAVVLGAALEKSPDRRYQSAAHFAEDLRRVRCFEPIAARAPGLWRRLWRWRQRHPAIAAGILFVSVTVALFVAEQTHSIAAIRAANDETQAINRFLVEEMLQAVTPKVAKGKDPTAKEIFENAARRVDVAFPGDDATGAAVRHMLGASFSAIGEPAAAERLLARAAESRQRLFGADDARTLQSRGHRARVLVDLDRWQEAEPTLLATLAQQERSLGAEHPDTLKTIVWLAQCLRHAGKRAEAERRLREWLPRFAAGRGSGDADLLVARRLHGQVLGDLGRAAEAEPLMRDVLAQLLATRGPDDLLVDSVRGDLASLLHDLEILHRRGENWPEVERLYEESLAFARRIYSENHPAFAVALNNLASCQEDRGDATKDQRRLDRAEELYQQALAARIRIHGEHHSAVATTLNNLGKLLMRKKEYGKAAEILDRAVAMRRELSGPKHRDTVIVEVNRASNVLRGQGAEPALPLFQHTLAICEGNENVTATTRETVRYFLGDCLRRVGRPADAVGPLLSAYQHFESAVGAGNPQCKTVATALAEVHAALGQAADAAKWRELAK